MTQAQTFSMEANSDTSTSRSEVAEMGCDQERSSIPPNLVEVIKSTLTQALKDLHRQPPPDALWSLQQTAEYLGVKSQTLSLWNSRGKGPAPTKIGGRTMYRPEVVRLYAVEKTLPR